MRSNRRLLDFGALVLVNLLWAVQYPAYEIAAERMEPAALNFWTLALATAILVPFWWRGRAAARPSVRTSSVAIGEYLLMGLLGIIPPSVLLSWGIAHSSAANAAILSLTIPLLMTLLAVPMLGERLTPTRVACLALGLAGTLLISTRDLAQLSFSRTLLLGNVVLLLAGLGSAFYNTYSKKLLARYSEVEVLLYSYIVAAVACAVISILAEERPFFRVRGYGASTWLAVLSLGLLPWGLAMLLWMWVLKRLDVGQVSASIYLLPLFGLGLSVAMLHEHITAAQLIGGALTVVGTAVLTLHEGRQTASGARS